MERSLPRPLTWRLPSWWPWTLIAITAVFLVNFRGNGEMVFGAMFGVAPTHDWNLYQAAADRIVSGLSPYDARAPFCADVCAFRHSPLVAWFFAVPFPLEAWRLAHFAVLPLVGPRLAILTVLTWAFWADVSMGQPITFALVLGALAIRGHTWAGVGFLVLATLMPRPLMLPVAAWLLWNRPEVRVPFLLLSLVHLAVAWPWIGEWVGSLLSASSDMGLEANLAPSRWIGWWWLAIGIPAAVWLYRRGQLGLASLAISPYWFGYYLLMALLPRAGHDRTDRARHSPRAIE